MLPYIDVFGHQLAMYALLIMAGLVLGIIVGLLRAGRYQCKKEDVLFASFYGILGMIAGGKLLYFITIIPFLVENFKRIIASREMIQALMSGGFVFYGGILGAFAGIWIYTKQYKLKFIEFLEIMIPSVPLAHGIGRIGCFCAGCCYGREWKGPFAVVFQNAVAAPNNVPLFPVQLVEAFGNFLIFAVLIIVFRKMKTHGEMAGVYFIYYSIMRFFLEYMRADMSRGIWLGLSTSQWISIGILIIGIIVYTKRKDEEP